MEPYTIRFQLALFPKSPFFPERNNWNNIQAELTQSLEVFDGINIVTNAPDDLPHNVTRVSLSSKDETKLVQISPSKIDIFYNLVDPSNPDAEVEDLTSFFMKMLDTLSIQIKEWSRIGVIGSYFFYSSDYEGKKFMKKIFLTPKSSWSNFAVEITNSNKSKEVDINEVVKIAEGTYVDAKATSGENLRGLVATLDVNNKPKETNSLGRSTTIDLFKDLLERTKYQRLLEILNLASDAEETDNKK